MPGARMTRGEAKEQIRVWQERLSAIHADEDTERKSVLEVCKRRGWDAELYEEPIFGELPLIGIRMCVGDKHYIRAEWSEDGVYVYDLGYQTWDGSLKSTGAMEVLGLIGECLKWMQNAEQMRKQYPNLCR